MAQHFVVAGLFHVQDFAFQRQDRLKTPVAALFGRAAGALSLDQEQLGAFGLAFGAVGQFAGQASGVQRPFAAGKIAGFAGRLARARGFNGLVDDLAAHCLVLLEEGAQALVDERLHRAGNIGIQLAFGLPLKLRLRQLHADHRDQAFPHIVAAEVFLHIFEQP